VLNEANTSPDLLRALSEIFYGMADREQMSIPTF
jgi:hypothetical protein